MPRCGGASGSVRASTAHQLAYCAHDVHVFWPLITKWSPRSSARVRSDARSEPAFGSEKPWHQMSSPLRIRSRYAAFCSGVPSATIVGPTTSRPTSPISGGAPARASSSLATICSINVAPRPPCSAGQVRLTSRASYSLRCQPRRNSTRASKSAGISSGTASARRGSRASRRGRAARRRSARVASARHHRASTDARRPVDLREAHRRLPRNLALARFAA